MKKLTLIAAAIVLSTSLSVHAQDGKKQETKPENKKEHKKADAQLKERNKEAKKAPAEKKQKQQVDKSQN